MSFCKKCGYQLTDESHFCPKCGEAVDSTIENAPKAGNINVPGGLHCPKCGNKRLSPATESSTNGGFAQSHAGGRFTTITSNTVHRNYWLCHTCGHKFRNIENLEAEISSMEKTAKTLFICGIVFIIVAILIALTKIPIISILFGLFTFAVGGALILVGLIYKLCTKKPKQELIYLKGNCF